MQGPRVQKWTTDPPELALWAAWCGVGTTLRSSAESALNHRVISTDPLRSRRKGGMTVCKWTRNRRKRSLPNNMNEWGLQISLWRAETGRDRLGALGKTELAFLTTLTECKTSQPHEWGGVQSNKSTAARACLWLKHSVSWGRRLLGLWGQCGLQSKTPSLQKKKKKIAKDIWAENKQTRCSTLVLRQTQIKITMHHYTSTGPAESKG